MYYVCPGDGAGYPPSSRSQLYPPQAPSPPRGGGTSHKIILYPLDKHSYTQRVFLSRAPRELCTTLAILFGSLWPTSRQEKFKNYHIYFIPTFLDICILVLKIQYSRDTNSCRSATGSPQSSSVFITSFYVFSRQSRVALVEAGILMVD